MTTIAQTEIVEALAHIRGSFERQLAAVRYYRALRNIEDTLVDLMEDDEAVVQPLSSVRDLVIHRLKERSDFRALRTIDTIVPQLLDVLSLHAQPTDGMRPAASRTASDDGEPSLSEGALSAAVASVEASEALPSSGIEQIDQQLDVSHQPIAATECGEPSIAVNAPAWTNSPPANGTDTEALAPIVPQGFHFAPVIVPARSADSTDITNEPVDEQTSGAPHRQDADDARAEERAA